MRWGSEGQYGTGSLWGIDQDDNALLFCDLADKRVLIQVDSTIGNRDFRELICILVAPLGEYVTVLESIRDAFDVTTAQGEQLDFIGSWIGLPRQGFDDTRYKVFLQIQIDLILSAARGDANWTGTHNNILAICRTFLDGLGGGTIVLVNGAPYSFSLSIPAITDPVEFQILINFICKALYAGVLGQIIQVLAPDSLWNSEDVVVTGGGIFCSVSVVVPNCAILGTTTLIGDCPPPP